MILTLLALLSASSAPHPAGAQAAYGTGVSFDDLQLGDQTVRGFNPSFDAWVTPPAGSLGDDGVLDLFYAPSPLLGPPSSMTISLNNASIWSVPLETSSGSRRALQISLPKDLLRADINRVNLQFLLRLVDDDCLSADNPARYVTVFRDSRVRFGPEETVAAAPDLLQFPSPFLSATGPPVPVNVVVPDRAGREHFTAAAQLAARLGRNAGAARRSIFLHSAGEMTPSTLASGHVVLVGTPREIPWFGEADKVLPVHWKAGGAGVWVSADGAEVDPGDGLVAVAPSPWNSARALMAITGATPEAVEKAAAALSSGTAAGVAAGKVAVVPRLPPSRSYGLPVAGSVDFTLSDLGDQSTTLAGQGGHRFGVTFTAGMPDPSRNMSLELVTLHSAILDIERSSAAVTLNGTSVGSVPFGPDGGGLARSRLSIPAGVVRRGVNTLNLDFTLYLPPLQTACGAFADERAWVSLLSTTRVSIPQLPGPALDLEAYPYPFVLNRAIAPTALVLPEDPRERASALAMSMELGRWAQQDASALTAGLRSQYTDQELAGRHVVVFGTPSGNPTVLQAAPRLIASLADQPRPLERLGLIALARSAWNADRAMLLVSGTAPELLLPDTLALGQGPLTGTALFVGSDGRVIPVPEAVEIAEPAAPPVGASPAIFAATGVALLTIIALVVGALRRES